MQRPSWRCHAAGFGSVGVVHERFDGLLRGSSRLVGGGLAIAPVTSFRLSSSLTFQTLKTELSNLSCACAVLILELYNSQTFPTRNERFQTSASFQTVKY